MVDPSNIDPTKVVAQPALVAPAPVPGAVCKDCQSYTFCTYKTPAPIDCLYKNRIVGFSRK